MKSARVRDFHTILIGLLTQYDMAESRRELKRRQSPNIYRLGHLFKASQEAEDHAKKLGIWERDDKEAVERLIEVLKLHFIYERGQFSLSPLRQLEKRMKAWTEQGKLPKYGTVRDNPQPWAKVFG
jgi:hypothetical protein